MFGGGGSQRGSCWVGRVTLRGSRRELLKLQGNFWRWNVTPPVQSPQHDSVGKTLFSQLMLGVRSDVSLTPETFLLGPGNTQHGRAVEWHRGADPALGTP
ncbi:hypothetical protein Y1Q_0007597 [Alligator mississippiensis]|uniref:Uncharacterized protein n=1 Tax=Alligator mississippiensis TaxID=8496 RepID=A0A151LY33_ALLMI|nr:hypothetical protein Y1Q_0007597 [Alligator mississippiensis]